MIFTKKNIFINTTFKTKREMFTFIAKKAQDANIANDFKLIIDGFEKRESEGTTGFEDGFAIPHARVKGIKQPSIFLIKNKNNIQDWKSLDSNGVRYVIALLIPINEDSLHMDILSGVAAKMMSNDFKKMFKTGNLETIYEEFRELLKEISITTATSEIKIKKSSILPKKYIVGISACPAGIAHTFMAKQKMEDSAKKLGYEIYWETQGSKGQKNALSQEQINNASAIIIASDIDINLSRFEGKKILQTSTNDAIKNGTKLIKRSFNDSKVFNKKDLHHKYLNSYIKAFKSSFGTPWKFLSITASMVAIISLIGFSIYGRVWSTNGYVLNKALFQIQAISLFALYLSMPFMAATIAKKMTNNSREAFAITFIATVILNMPLMNNQWNSITGYVSGDSVPLLYDWNGIFKHSSSHGSNIIGALVITYTTIYLVKFVEKLKLKIALIKNENLSKIIIHGTSPWLSTTFVAIAILIGVVFTFGAPLEWVSSKITYGIIDYSNNFWWLRFIIGGVIGSLIVWDLGGTVNKITIIFLIGFAQYDLRFASFISIGIPLASIGYGMSYKFFRKRFKDEDAISGKVSLRKGLDGISEGPLLLTNKYGWRVKIPNILSSFIAVGLGYVIGIYIFKGGHIGIWYIGAQAHLAQINDIGFLSALLPVGQGIVTAVCSILYGIIGYILVMFVGAMTYVLTSYVTFSWPGELKVWQQK